MFVFFFSSQRDLVDFLCLEQASEHKRDMDCVYQLGSGGRKRKEVGIAQRPEDGASSKSQKLWFSWYFGNVRSEDRHPVKDGALTCRTTPSPKGLGLPVWVKDLPTSRPRVSQ